jgi:transcriptional regulator with GAF, ATPase, and Fis domain
MGTDPIIAPQSDSHRYEAVVRISEAIAACREPEELARTLADEIGKFLQFDHLYFIVLKENSKEIEYLVWGKGPIPDWPDLPIEELPMWDAVRSRDPLHIPDWDTEEQFPRFKEWAKKIGLGSGVRIPLTTPHRRLGVFGLNRDTVNPFSEEEISFLRLIGRVVAFALDDGLNFRRAQHHSHHSSPACRLPDWGAREQRLASLHQPALGDLVGRFQRESACLPGRGAPLSTQTGPCQLARIRPLLPANSSERPSTGFQFTRRFSKRP